MVFFWNLRKWNTAYTAEDISKNITLCNLRLHGLSTVFYSSTYIHNSADDQMGLAKLFHEIAVTSTADLQPEDFRDVLQQQNIK